MSTETKNAHSFTCAMGEDSPVCAQDTNTYVTVTLDTPANTLVEVRVDADKIEQVDAAEGGVLTEHLLIPGETLLVTPLTADLEVTVTWSHL